MKVRERIGHHDSWRSILSLTGLQVWALARAQFLKGGIPNVVEPRIFGFRWRLMARWKALLLLYNVVKRVLYVACILIVFRPLKVLTSIFVLHFGTFLPHN